MGSAGGSPDTRSTIQKKKLEGEDFGEPPKSAREPRALPTELEKEIMAELKRHFRPEFLNRVDDVIIFQSLDEEELSRIVDIQLEKLKKRLAQQNLTLDVDKAAKKLLAKEGYDPQFGARPLKRAIQEHILNPLSMRLLEGDLSGLGSRERNLSRFAGRRPLGRASGRERVHSSPACRAVTFAKAER
jgi:ATP-dependent Clp protease ATP-binding subunit ClpC